MDTGRKTAGDRATDPEKLAALARTRRRAYQKLLDRGFWVYQAFLQMERAAFRDGALPKKTKELIAIGISVRIDCESCMQWPIEQAATAGASWCQVLEAVEVGIEMGGGPACRAADYHPLLVWRFAPHNQRIKPTSAVKASGFSAALRLIRRPVS